jgi:hypothetical protein
MGITPITNLLPLAVSRAPQSEMDPRPMERIASSSRIGDETYSHGEDRSASGSDEDGSDDSFNDHLDDGEDLLRDVEDELDGGGGVNVFA